MVASSAGRVLIHEVSVRDGFQIEPRFIATEQKVALIDALSHTGVAKIEVTSFASPKAIPALADAAEVMRSIERVPGIEYAALVPNMRGCERALACDVDEINVVVSASETHNLANVRMSCDDSLLQLKDIAVAAKGHAHINVSLSTAFGCPFEGDVALDRVLHFMERIADLGVERASLCDTTGMANPVQVGKVFTAVRRAFPHVTLTAHFHNTRSMGLANAVAAFEAGIVRFDASLGGLGGCPFAPGASGNVCTEDLVHMFIAMGHETGVDLAALLQIAQTLPAIVGHDVPGQVMKAGPAWRRYPSPP